MGEEQRQDDFKFDVPTDDSIPDWHLEGIERRLASYGGKFEGEDGRVVLERLRALNAAPLNG